MKEVTESELKTLSVAPRVTEKELDANIVGVVYLNLGDAVCKTNVPGSDSEGQHLTTLCIITLANGFIVTGQSACASLENYNKDIGERIAFANAREKIWPLMGYALKERLHQESSLGQPRSGPNQFRKKPVVIEAIQWHQHGDHPNVVEVPPERYDELSGLVNLDPDSHGWIKTLEGGHVVTSGDWIITGIKGEQYPCKPEIFEATYEKA